MIDRKPGIMGMVDILNLSREAQRQRLAEFVSEIEKRIELDGSNEAVFAVRLWQLALEQGDKEARELCEKLGIFLLSGKGTIEEYFAEKQEEASLLDKLIVGDELLLDGFDPLIIPVLLLGPEGNLRVDIKEKERLMKKYPAVKTLFESEELWIVDPSDKFRTKRTSKKNIAAIFTGDNWSEDSLRKTLSFLSQKITIKCKERIGVREFGQKVRGQGPEVLLSEAEIVHLLKYIDEEIKTGKTRSLHRLTTEDVSNWPFKKVVEEESTEEETPQ